MVLDTRAKRAIKNDKYKPSLTYTSLLQEISKVRKFGIQKYGDPEDWRNIKNYTNKDWLDAALRHLNDCKNDVYNRDEESGEMHLSHAVISIMFLIEKKYTEQRSKK